MDRRQQLERIGRRAGLLAIYLFGSRADDGLVLLSGGEVAEAGSDLDVGVVFEDPAFDPRRLSGLQVDLEDLFAPLRVDVVPLQRVDALFAFEGIDGHCVFAADGDEVAEYELVVMRRAAELLPLQRRIELDLYGVSTA